MTYETYDWALARLAEGTRVRKHEFPEGAYIAEVLPATSPRSFRSYGPGTAPFPWLRYRMIDDGTATWELAP